MHILGQVTILVLCDLGQLEDLPMVMAKEEVSTMLLKVRIPLTIEESILIIINNFFMIISNRNTSVSILDMDINT